MLSFLGGRGGVLGLAAGAEDTDFARVRKGLGFDTFDEVVDAV